MLLYYIISFPFQNVIAQTEEERGRELLVAKVIITCLNFSGFIVIIPILVWNHFSLQCVQAYIYFTLLWKLMTTHLVHSDISKHDQREKKKKNFHNVARVACFRKRHYWCSSCTTLSITRCIRVQAFRRKSLLVEFFFHESNY